MSGGEDAELNACKVVNRKFDTGISYSIEYRLQTTQLGAEKIKIRKVMYARETERVGQ